MADAMLYSISKDGAASLPLRRLAISRQHNTNGQQPLGRHQ
jgi:hypothetical protein